MKKFIIILFLLFCFTSQSFAFDGDRKGFTLGGGVNFAPYAKFQLDSTSISKTSISFGLHTLVGYNFTHEDLIAWQFTGNLHVPTKSDNAYFQGFNGVSWYHYFNNAKSYYTILGVGQLLFVVSNNFTSDITGSASKFPRTQSGFGYLIGGGYELTKHWHLSLFYYGGKAGSGNVSNNDVITFALTAMAF